MNTDKNALARPTSSLLRNAMRKLFGDRRGAELVEVLIVLGIVALGGLAAMKGIRDSTSTKANDVKNGIGGIEVGK